MHRREEIDSLAGNLRSCFATTEEEFLGFGRSLESSITILGGLQGIFGKLSGELDSDELRAATQALKHTAAEVGQVADAYQQERSQLDRLNELAAAIATRLPRMSKALRAVQVLAINAKVAAAGITGEGGDFQDFLSEIGRPLKEAQTSLDGFSKELAAVGSNLRTAAIGRAEFEKRQAEAIRSSPQHLAASVAAITARTQRAAEASVNVGARSEQVSRRVGNAVLALQIGDNTRQRVEHIEYALGWLADLLDEGKNGHAAGLTAAEQGRLGALLCELQAAQLSDTGKEFERELHEIGGVLDSLAADAREIVRLGDEAFATDGGKGSFLLTLERDVGRARELLDGFRIARTGCDEVMAVVANAAGKLMGYVAAIRSLEVDIRIMGLNTTLKCDRLGTQGRAMRVIAQELRTNANETAVEAGILMADLQKLVATVKQLGRDEQEKRAAQIAGISAEMATSLRALGTVGQSLDGALAALHRDGDEVVRLLEETKHRVARQLLTADALPRSAALLTGIGAKIDCRDGDNAAARDEMLAQLAATYTMERERAVHNLVLGVPAAPTAAAPASSAPAAADALDDFLF